MKDSKCGEAVRHAFVKSNDSAAAMSTLATPHHVQPATPMARRLSVGRRPRRGRDLPLRFRLRPRQLKKRPQRSGPSYGDTVFISTSSCALEKDSLFVLMAVVWSRGRQRKRWLAGNRSNRSRPHVTCLLHGQLILTSWNRRTKCRHRNVFSFSLHFDSKAFQ